MALRDKIRSFLEDSRRIFTVSRKPDWSEYIAIIKITGLGIILIAIVGYIIILIFTITGLGS